ncbi:MAG TPA: hypothetical protein PK787_00640, partial [Burkholderiaceae bacterium]|nr:hypothetical protein [Burkholderiaceae bacterium]
PFIDSVTVTMPYLEWRSVAGAMLTIGHLVFVGHFLAMALRFGPNRAGAALFWTPPGEAMAHGK